MIYFVGVGLLVSLGAVGGLALAAPIGVILGMILGLAAFWGILTAQVHDARVD